MTETTIKATKNKSAPSSEVSTNQQQQQLGENETKLIIENKEFEVIKYSCEDNDKWYIGELGLMIEKKVMKRDDWTFKKGDIFWDGSSSGKEKEQFKKLIYFGENEVNHWKKKIQELSATYLIIRNDKKISDQLADYQTRLQKAIKGWEYLKKCQTRTETKSQELPTKNQRRRIFSPNMPKLHDLTAKIISKEPRKVYKKNEFYGQINYQLRVMREENGSPEYETIRIYSNLVSQSLLKVLEKNQYLDKRYFFTCQKKRNGLILQDWKELDNLKDHDPKT